MEFRRPADGSLLPGPGTRQLKNAPLDEGLFASMRLIDVRQDVFRNIVSLRESQNLFDDLTDDPAQWALAQEVEDAVKPPPYVSDKNW